MNVLVLNCGSSSIKFQMFRMPEAQVTAKGIVEKIGESQPAIKYEKPNFPKSKSDLSVKNHEEALKEIFKHLTHPEFGVIKSVDEIEAVGHRVVHGGEEIQASCFIDDAFVEVVERLSVLAPLHNPPNLTGIRICRNLLPKTPNVGVFDTAFHSTLPKYAYLYALPYEWYEKFQVRRYGFHGTSHYFVSRRAAVLDNKAVEDLKIITCHLGNGCSITAVDKGKSVDTSMGLTPMEGLVMGTRCGDIDPAIANYLESREDCTLSLKEIDQSMNKKSGLLGISGVSNDIRELHDCIDTNARARLAVEITSYRIRKYIGAYAAAMGGLDVLAFTGGIGENDPLVREWSTQGLEYMGISLDLAKNETLNRKEGAIHAPQSRVRVYIVPTDEELVIAQDTYRITKNGKQH